METKTSYMYIIQILLLNCAIIYQVGANIPYADVKSDFETLLSAYQGSHSGELHDVIPKNLTSGPLVVYLGFSLHGMLGFDAVDGALQLGGSLNVVWQDEIREMAGVTFKQTESPIVVTKDQIWTPDLVVVNGQDFDGKLGDADDNIRYNTSTGECTWDITLIMKVTCTSYMLYFPYDEHTCGLTVRSWLHGSSDVQLNHSAEQWNIDYLEPSALWDVTGTSTELNTQKTHDAIFKITIKRKPQFIVTVMLTPTLIISFLSLFSFIIPPFSQERICFTVMCFVSYVVLLDCLTNIIPRALFPGSLVCVYVLIMFILNVAVCIVNVVMMRIHFGKFTGKVPELLQIFINIITLRRCKSVSKVQDMSFPLERQDTVFNTRFPTKSIGEELNGETIAEEEEDSVFELSDDNCDTTDRTGEYGRSTAYQEQSSEQTTELTKDKVGIINIEQAVDSVIVENSTDLTRERGAGYDPDTSNVLIDPEKASISSLETTYTIRSVAIKPTMVEEGYTLSFNTYLPRGLHSNKMKTSIRHDLIPKRSRSKIGRKGKQIKTNTDITPVENAPAMFQAVVKPSNEVTRTTDDVEQTNTESCSDGKDSGVSDDCSKLGASASDRSDRAYMSASDIKTESEDGRTPSTRISTSTFRTSFSSATTKIISNEMTWSHVGRVLDIFFMVLFAVVHIIFTIAFMVPMSRGN